MIVDKISKQTVQKISENLCSKLVKDPMFMFLCPVVEDRAKFMDAFFNYYLYEWAEFDTLLCNEEKTVVITLIDPRTFEYRFKGKGAFKLRRKSGSDLILEHRKTLRNIVHIIAPSSMNPRVLSVYANAQTDIPALNELVDEAVETAQKNKLTLVYETFSKKLIDFMQKKGFTIAYQRGYSDTRFVQTIMTYSAFDFCDDMHISE